VPALTAIGGTVLLSCAAAGYWQRNLHMYERAILLAGALLLIQPGWMTDAAGLAVGVAVYLLQKVSR
ncbi:MAG: DUF3394 domain-containing protein, partial [Pyramidobacter sp.]|nr:DUF3394 domain-containing protein [Pyramidobacter sp.]